MRPNTVLLCSYILSSCMLLSLTACSSENPLPDKPDGPDPGKRYSISIQGADEAGADTRALLDTDEYYKWENGDQVGLFMGKPGVNAYHQIYNLPMSATCTDPAVKSPFSGTVTGAQIIGITASDRFDYYSYYPHQQSANYSAYPVVKWNMPSTISVQKGVVPSDYTPMIATKLTNKEPLTWLEGSEQKWPSETIHFQYEHALCLMKLALNLNLNGLPIKTIRIESNNGVFLSGTLNLNLVDGSCGYAAGSNSYIVVNIGSDADDATRLKVNTTGTDYIYVPMPSGTHSLKMTFTNTAGEVIEKSNLINVTFRPRTINQVRVSVPGYIDLGGLKDAGLEGVSPGSAGRQYKGFTLRTGGASGKATLKDHHAELLGDWGISPSHADEGSLKLSPFDITNTLGKTTITASVKIYACGFPTIANADRRRILYQVKGVGSASEYDLSVSKDPYFQLDYQATNGWAWRTYTGTANGSNPVNVTLQQSSYLTFQASCIRGTSTSSVSAGRIQKIWVEPVL